MKRRALPILGVAGLALLSVTAPAQAAADKVDICHAGKMISVSLNAAALNGHAGHNKDIIAPSEFLPAGLNWVAGQGFALCGAVVTPPGEEQPPVDEHPPGEEQPPVDEHPHGEEQPPVDEHPPGEEHPPTEEQPPVKEQPPAVVPETPVTPTPPAVVPEAPVVQTPAAATPAGLAAAPQVAVAKVPAAAVSRGTNQGFNAQTAVGVTEGSSTWLAGLGVLLGAGAVVSVRRKSRTEAPAAG